MCPGEKLKIPSVCHSQCAKTDAEVRFTVGFVTSNLTRITNNRF